jgi:hypothetical protein
MATQYSGSIIITGFLGMDALNEKMRGKSIADLIRKLVDMGR